MKIIIFAVHYISIADINMISKDNLITIFIFLVSALYAL